MFAWLVLNSLSNRLLVVVAGVALMVCGAWALSGMPVDVFPDLDKPTVTVATEAGGMAPEEVEQRIALPLEAALGGLPGVEAIRSTSSAGLSFVYVTFHWRTDIFRARQLVAERLAAMEDSLPAGGMSQMQPRMGPVSSIMGEIMQVALPYSASGGSAAAMAAREYADWVLRPRLLALPGVAQVIPIGGEVRQFQVQPDTQRMAALGVTHGQLEDALRGFSSNTSGGFLALNGRELLIRHLGGGAGLDDLRQLAVGVSGNAGSAGNSPSDRQPVRLHQVADVLFAAATQRGDAGFDGAPAVILGIQKQPAADTLALTHAIESALTGLQASLPAGMQAPQVTFRQASFIQASIGTLQGKLIGASVLVAVILFVFLGSLRPTVIALVAIPVSVLASILVFKAFGLSINTMTLGGLAIAIGGLVDDAVVGVENVMRRLRAQRPGGDAGSSVLRTVAAATMEVRSAILYATAIIVLVFVPLFALPGLEGRLFVPLGVAFIVSTVASLLVSVTVTPVLASWLLPRTDQPADDNKLTDETHGETRLLRWLKARYQPALQAVLRHPVAALAAGGAAVLLAAAAVPFFPTSFLPPFNEGSLLIGLRLNPGVTLADSAALGRQAELLVRQVPGVTHVGRRSGRAELDEHAEGVHVNELDVGLQPAAALTRPLDAIKADIRARLANLPAGLEIGQPISHRIDHMLSGVRSQIAIKIFGDDLDALRGQAETLRARLAKIPGIADLQIEKLVLAPQIAVRVDQEAAAAYGLAVPQVLAMLQSLVQGEQLAQVAEGNRRFALVLRLPEQARAPEALGRLLIETPRGRIPLGRIASIEEGDGPNQISRDDGRRRIVLSANAQGRALSDIVADVRAVVADTQLPGVADGGVNGGSFITLGGQFQAQEEAKRLVGLLSLASLSLMFLVLYSRYRSAVLAALIMANIPLALVGAVLGLWVAGQPLSVAALVGFITLAGISVRNGILKVSHYINLMRLEGAHFDQAMIVRGSLERLSPVLMTALVTALALAPLLLEAERPGTEVLHPVAVVVFCGLVSATLLDTFLTPAMFWLFGRKASQALLAGEGAQSREVL